MTNSGESSFQRRIIVTGGAGFVGSHLCSRLLADGHAVICVDNYLTGCPDNISDLHHHSDFQMMVHDVTKPFTVDGPVYAVIHLASPASPRDYLKFPIETLRAGSLGTFTALELARDKNARLLYASSSEVYGDPQVHPQPESYWGHVNPIGPRSVYDEAKRFGEAACAAYRTRHQVNTGIMRVFNTYGPRMKPDDGRMVPTFIRQALDGDPITIFGSGQQTRSLCYIDDLIEVMLRMIHSDYPGPTNLGSPSEMSVRETALLIRELTGSSSSIIFLPAMADDPQMRNPDILLAKEALDWEPVIDVRDGLTRTISWFRQNYGLTSIKDITNGVLALGQERLAQ